MSELKPTGTWIPPENRTIAWYLFSELYQCKIRLIDSLSTDYISHFGLPDSGDVLTNKETANELIIRMLTIDQMAEYYKAGITVHVVNFKDTKKIYERISDHLNDWKQKLATSFHIKDAPIDDLLVLDQLANVVYKHAVSQFNNDVVESLLARKMSGAMKVNRTSILKPPPNLGAVTINKAPEQPQRESMSSAFLSMKPNSASRWK